MRPPSPGERQQLEDAAVFGGGFDVALAQRLADGDQLRRVVDREVGRPAAFLVLLDRLDRDFGEEAAPADELDGFFRLSPWVAQSPSPGPISSG
jgi:hypothetical protein